MAKPHASPFLHHHYHKVLLFSRPSSSSCFHPNKPLLYLPSSLEFPLRDRKCSYQVTRVTTAPVERAAPTPPEPDDFLSEIARLKALRSKLAVSREMQHKDAVVNADPRVHRFFTENRGGFAEVLGSIGLTSSEMFVVKCLVAAGQEHAFSLGYEEAFVEREESSARSSMKNALYALVEMIERFDVNSNDVEGRREHGLALSAEEVGHLRKFLKFLEEIEQFYDCIGGIIGYQIMVLELLQQATRRQITNRSHFVEESLDGQYLEIHLPNVLDLTQKKEYASQAALWGIETWVKYIH